MELEVPPRGAAMMLPAVGPVVQLYFVDGSGQRLALVQRNIGEATLMAVMEALADGPTRAERRQGLRTAFPGDEAIANVGLVGGVGLVDLTEQFRTLDGPTQRLAIAQTVLTLTARPGVGRVAFSLQGSPIDVPRGDGTLVQGSVSRDNYVELLPAA
jgi:spore germination protein GerM